MSRLILDHPHLTSLASLLLLAPQFCAAQAADLELAWDPSPDPNAATYAVYARELGVADVKRVDAADSGTVTLTDLLPGKTYFIYAVAIDGSGQESAPSNTLLYSPGTDLVDNPTTAGASAAVDATGTEPASSDSVLSQTFTTVPGQSYSLSFQLGALSAVADTQQKTLQLIVQGESVLLSQALLVVVPGAGTSWGTQTVSFTADSISTTFRIQDTLPTDLAVGFLLDGVQLTVDKTR